MPDYELLYLSFGGRATPIRLMLTYLGIPFKDTTFDMQKEWPLMKPSLPFGQGPVLVIDKTVKLAQTPAILHFLAKEHGLEPEGNLNQAVAEMFALQCQDAMVAIRPWIMSVLHKESEEKVTESWNTVAVPQFRDTFGKFFEAQLKKNGSGYLVGDKISWVDFLAAYFCDMLQNLGNSSILDEYPNLRLLWESIYTHPKLIAAVEKEHSYPL
uniref:Glutathione S-transferase n=1 Tax=Panagrolaimus sp. ES5 TaxID=591445 RepID=A0AC34GY66_9BILA